MEFLKNNVVLIFVALFSLIAIYLLNKRKKLVETITNLSDTTKQTTDKVISSVLTGVKLLSNKETLGYRQKNPLNIRPNGDKWKGLVGASDNSVSYLSFSDFKYGYRAGFRTLRSYFEKRKLNTISLIIPTWAPSADNNDPQSYISFVEKKSGINRNQKLTFDFETYSKLVHAMSILESQVEPSIELLKESWELEKA